MEGKLVGKVAFVTGGSKGIGKSTAMAFAKEGAKVVIMARGEDCLQATAEEIAAAGGEVSKFIGDVMKEEDCKKAVEFCVSTYGALHIAFNNAGVYMTTPFVEASEDMVDTLFGTNLKSIIFAFKYQIPAMAKSGDNCSIIVCSSVMSQRAQATFRTSGIYAASKAGVDMLVRYGAIEAAEFGIRVNAVNPGIVDTPLWKAVPKEVVQGFCEKTQMFARVTTPEEVAEVVTFLASDSSKMITGAMHTIDGGWGLKA